MFSQAMITENKPYAHVMKLVAFPFHWHHEIEIVCCLEGSFTATINGQNHTVCEGQSIFVGSTEPHAYTDISPETRILLIEMGAFLLKKDFQHLAKMSFDRPVADNDSCGLKGLFDKLLSAIKEPILVGEEWVMMSCLFELAAFMLHALPDGYISNQKLERIQAMQRVNNALDYVHANYQKKITVEKAAQLAGYGKNNFFKQFKKATQMTFHQYLNMFRVNIACVMLKGDEPIAAIAEEVGFPETKTFCRVFRSFMNMTPTEYRKFEDSSRP